MSRHIRSWQTMHHRCDSLIESKFIDSHIRSNEGVSCRNDDKSKDKSKEIATIEETLYSCLNCCCTITFQIN